MVPNKTPLAASITMTRLHLGSAGPTLKKILKPSPLTVEMLHPVGRDIIISPNAVGVGALALMPPLGSDKADGCVVCGAVLPPPNLKNLKFGSSDLRYIP